MNNDEKARNQCGCLAVMAVINLAVGWWSVNYLLEVFFNKTIPIFWAVAIGIIGGQFTIPAALIAWILKMLGVF
jgi:hypothetical protein